MRRLTTYLAMASVALAACAASTQRPDTSARAENERSTAQSALIGSWHLLWLELPGPDGALRRISDATGSLIYTPDGHVSVQVMYARASDTPSSGPVQYAQGGYEGSFGRYVVDASTQTVTHRYDGTNVRALLGQDLPRRYEITGRRLVIRSTRADEHWSVTWERDSAVVR